jgi:hypothetical protein
MFWHWEDIDRVYGGGLEDDECNEMIAKVEEEIRILESELAESAVAIQREEKLNELGL